MRIRSLHHASVRVSDLARARDFYEGLLGLRTAPRPDLGLPGAWYDLEPAQVHLIAQPGTPGTLGAIDPTGPHFALEVESVADVKRILDARGVAYLEFGGPQLWIQDPDGNVVELCERA
jgi:catechol 2,3-dioxygenase-like lactoylglutathione lyase family enzyme